MTPVEVMPDQELAVVLTPDEALGEALVLCRGSISAATQTPQAAVRMTVLAVQLRDVADGCAYLQGALLVRLQHDGLWRRVPGCEELTWTEFVEDKLALGSRRERYLRVVYERSLALGITAEEVEAVGWTKLREVLTVATRENIGQWLRVARTEPSARIAQRVRRARAARSPEPPQIADAGAPVPEPVPDVDEDDAQERWSLLMTVAQRRNVMEAIALLQREARGRGELLSDGDAMDLLVTDWRGNRINRRDQALAWIVRQVERAYGVRLTVEQR